MKKKIWIILVAICAIFIFNAYINLSEPAENSNAFFVDADSIEYMSKVDEESFYIYVDGIWEKTFVKGVNIGAAKPGFFPGEFGITKNDYMRWFKYISDMNANTIRVYTILKPEFYTALYEFNESSDSPLYLIQGVWINEEDIAEYKDAYNPIIKDAFMRDVETVINVLHGDEIIKRVPGHAYGIYDKDLSPYVLGYILGIEWDPGFVISTNENNQANTDYDGEYLYSQDASPFENFLCEIGDYCIGYETENYAAQRPVSFANWVTTDVLSHPNEPLSNEDMVSVDMEHIKRKETFKTGVFASYHIYPYYPDAMNYQKEYTGFIDEDGEINTYRAYLKDLKKEHTMPVVVAEFGIPSSRGKAHESIHMGFNQGNVSEEDQGIMDAAMLDSMYEEGYAGGLVFAFQDEWFKRTWNTMDFDIPDRRPFWNNQQTNEQYFGVLAFDSGETKSVCYVDGEINDWKDDMPLVEQNENALYMKSDEEYVYFMVKASGFDFMNDNLIIPLDVISNQGNTAHDGASYGRDADFLISIKGREDSKILVDPYYDSFQYLYGQKLNMVPKNENYDVKDSGAFIPIDLCLNRELYLPVDEKTLPFESYETGKLAFGNGNPESGEYYSLSDFYVKDNIIEIRIPWMLINVMDPSSKMIMDDLHIDGIKPLKIDGIYAGVGISNNQAMAQEISMNKYSWEPWEIPTYHERLKPSYYILRDAFNKYE